jgi:hypothetical protein
MLQIYYVTKKDKHPFIDLDSLVVILQRPPSFKVTKLRNLTMCTHSRHFSPYKNTFPTSFLKFKSQNFQCKQNFLTLAISEPAAQKAEYCIDRAANLIISYLTQNTFARKNLLK